LLSILLFISLSSVGFFAYQVQNLTKELLESRNQNLATQIPTSNWKTYTNAKYNFLFKHPKNWTESIDPVMPGAQFTSLVTYIVDSSTGSEFRVGYFPHLNLQISLIGQIGSDIDNLDGCGILHL